ncbi:hypothetical protein [Vagococcus intermedius]|uniref:DUF4352 domain-containing protein n=1 Tax=Vagococcus intermedius TaxID=2991418 RepID=A0AAF0I7I7_9ENTE|nr:hypothetical protein [Vagococcus intermedius]WEG74383.1 hypothetical protein OL234_10785 [Vagococcus intermedius]WEG76505.1 hypothetical protein OL235_10950 [Vagococcus intermedius]
MAKKIKGENGKVYKEHKPFYKKVWFWILAVVVVVVAIGSLGGGEDETPKDSAKSAGNTKVEKHEKKEEKNLLVNHKKYKNIASNAKETDEVEFVEDKSYKVELSNSDWAEMKVGIDEVSIVKVNNYEDYGDKTAEGFAVIHVNLDDIQRDITAYPQQGTILTNTGQQSEGHYEISGWDGELMKGANKGGYAAFPIEKLESVEDINNIRFSFSAVYDTDDYDDENSRHEYDITIDLK